MAKGKKTGGRDFKKGKPGGPGRHPLPVEIKEARLMNASKFEGIIYKYMDKPIEALRGAMTDPSTPAIDLVVIKLLVLAIQHGDIARLNLLLERTIGKVTDKIQVDNNTTIRNLHDAIIQKLENGGQ